VNRKTSTSSARATKPSSRVKATGTRLEFRFVHAFTVRNRKVVRFEEFLDVSPLVAELRAALARH
jgi:ketosteroid isomerase-like protein